MSDDDVKQQEQCLLPPDLGICQVMRIPKPLFMKYKMGAWRKQEKECGTTGASLHMFFSVFFMSFNAAFFLSSSYQSYRQELAVIGMQRGCFAISRVGLAGPLYSVKSKRMKIVPICIPWNGIVMNPMPSYAIMFGSMIKNGWLQFELWPCSDSICIALAAPC